MKPVTQVVTVTLLCLLFTVPTYYCKPIACSVPVFTDSSMCLNTTNPIVWYNTTVDLEVAKNFAEADFAVLIDRYNTTGNVTNDCTRALQELLCTYYFRPCNLDSSIEDIGICNSTSLRVINACGNLPNSPPNTYFPYVDDTNPSYAYAFQPQCSARQVVRAGEIVSPYRIDNNYELNYNYTTVCDLFSFSQAVDGDHVCKEMPDFGSPCPEGVGWTTWFISKTTSGVTCIEQKFTLENKRHGEPCFDNSECLNSNCTAGYCYEHEYGCTTEFSCRPGMYCNTTSICTPLRAENQSCGTSDPCLAPFTCVLGFCVKPASVGEACEDTSPGSLTVQSAPFCGPKINTIYDIFTSCQSNVCTYDFQGIGSPCVYGGGDNCDPFVSVCNGTSSAPAGYCVAPEELECSIGDATCGDAQYCDCTGGAGTKGICKTNTNHPMIGCQTEYVALFECLREKCDAYDSRGQFYQPSYYPFDGYSCGNTKCANETKGLYCCIVDLNGGVGKNNISAICETVTPTPTSVPTTTAVPTTSSVPTTSAAPTTTTAPTTTSVPTTTAVPTTVVPTTTTVPTSTVAPTTTTAPTTTVAPTTAALTTTLSPTSTLPPTTTTVPTTTTIAPTGETVEPTMTSAPTIPSIPTTTVTPTTVVPTTTDTPTTKAPATIVPTSGSTTVQTTTMPPTTLAPIVTSVPIAVTTSGTASAVSSGNVAEIPKPVISNSVVLYSSANASSIVPLSFANKTELPKNAIVQQAKVTFTVTYIEKKVTVLVTLTDEFGDIAGSVRAEISTNGTINVDISALYNQILAENQKKIEIRAIRGSILKVSLSVETANVAVNLDTSSVSSAVVYAIVQAPTTTAPTTPAPTTVPTTTKPSLSTATKLQYVTGILVACIALYIN